MDSRFAKNDLFWRSSWLVACRWGSRKETSWARKKKGRLWSSSMCVWKCSHWDNLDSFVMQMKSKAPGLFPRSHIKYGDYTFLVRIRLFPTQFPFPKFPYLCMAFEIFGLWFNYRPGWYPKIPFTWAATVVGFSLKMKNFDDIKAELDVHSLHSIWWPCKVKKKSGMQAPLRKVAYFMNV